MKKLGRPIQGKQIKEVVSIRIEPRIKERIMKRYKSIQQFFDLMIKEENEKS